MFSGDTFKRFLRTLGAAPTTSGQLGYITTISIADGTTIAQSTVSNVATFTVPTTGIYYISYTLTTASTVTVNRFNGYIQNNTGGTYYGASAVNSTQFCDPSFFVSINGSAIISLTAGEIWRTKYLFSSSAAATFVYGSYMQATRIA